MIKSHSAIFFLTFLFILTANNVFAVLETGHINYSFKPAQVYAPLGDSNTNLIVQSDGKVLTAGRFTVATQGTAAVKLVRFLPNGQIDNSLNPDYPVANIRLTAFTLQDDGKIVYAYQSRFTGNYEKVEVVRINSDGSSDGSFAFNFPLEGVVNQISVQPNGKILIAGSFQDKSENPVPLSIVRLNSDGSIDQTFNNLVRTNNLLKKMSMNSNGSFYALENSDFSLPRYSPSIKLFDTNGNLNASVQTGFSDEVLSIDDFSVQSDGKIVVTGKRVNNSDYVYFTERLLPNGSFDAQFQSSNLTGLISSQNDGKVIINSKVRLLQNGVVDKSFVNGIAEGKAYPQADGSIYVRGQISIGGRAYGLIKLFSNYTPFRQRATDFDGDGKADIAVFRPSNGVWYWLNSSDNSFAAVQFGANGDIPVAGDYDNDTRTDVAVFRPSNGVWYRLNSSNNEFSAAQFGGAEDIPTPNDYDGDGKTDVAVFRPSNGVWYRLNSSDNSFVSQGFGIAGDKAISGDYDGDGKADLSVWRPSNDIWYQFSSIENALTFKEVGYYDGDYAVPADYDADGKLDLTQWKDISGDWYGTRSSVGNGFYFHFGMPGDVPVSADYDGDNKDDFGVFRPSTGTWWIIYSSTTSIIGTQFGAAGDIPIPAKLTRN